MTRILTIDELAARWRMSVGKAKRICRVLSVPFVRLGPPTDMRVCWKAVRFRVDAIEQWERQNQSEFPAVDAAPRPKEATTPRRLGAWE